MEENVFNDLKLLSRGNLANCGRSHSRESKGRHGKFASLQNSQTAEVI